MQEIFPSPMECKRFFHLWLTARDFGRSQSPPLFFSASLASQEIRPLRPVRFVKEGSEILILGSVLIGERPHWLQGEIKDTFEPLTVTNRDINKAVGMTIHNPIFVNYWAERCSLEIKETVTVLINEALKEALEVVVTNEDIETSDKSGIHATSVKSFAPGV